MDVKNRFILLRKVRYGEADLILQAISTLGEKASFMARGALRSRQRFGGGVLEPGNFVQLSYRRGGEGKMHVLKEAVLINGFPGLRADYDRLDLALHVLEAVGRVSQEGDSSSEFLFNLLGHTLKAIETASDLAPLKAQFYLKFLLQQGVLTGEPWMAPFLKTNIADHESLAGERIEAARRIPGLEMLIQQYIKTAEG